MTSLTKHLNKQLIKDYPADCALTKVLLLHPLQVLLLLLRLPCDLLQQVLDNFWLTKKISPSIQNLLAQNFYKWYEKD